jgi:NadR type nicotinamide-nucleotide adenylyltransferase
MIKKIGLFLGKFSILHKGHQYVIEAALKEVDELIVLIYDSPGTTRTPLSVRANWIRVLYPAVKVVEGWNAPEETGYTEEIKRLQEQYVIEMLDGTKVTHFYSSELYGEHMSKALNCKNRVIDIDRNNVKISASKIQKNAYKYKEFISPVVYKDLIINIVFVGSVSTGKSTIAGVMAKELDTNFMPEYGREYWEKHQINRRLTLGQLVEIAEGHIQRENKLLEESNKYLFTDTNAITTYMFSLNYHKKASKKLIELSKKAENRYDIVFLCGDDIPYDETWDRSGDVNRKIFQRKIIADLLKRKIPYIDLKGTLEERVDKVKQVLEKYEKYTSLGKNL